MRTQPHSNGKLFDEPIPEFHLPQLAHHFLDDALDEMELLGFTICNVFDLVDDEMVREGTNHGGGDAAPVRVPTHWNDKVVSEGTNHGGKDDSSTGDAVSDTTMLNSSNLLVQKKYISASDMQQYLGKKITMLGYLITWKPVHTIKKELMYFGTFIDERGDWLDTVHFPDSVQRYPLQGKGFYRMTGVVVAEFGVYNLEVHGLEKVGIKSRAATKAAALPEQQKGWQQGLVNRE